MRTAFIGLGVMGYPMAGYLSKAKHDVTVYNRTASKAAKWAVDHESDFAETPALAARGAEIVFTCVGDDNDVRDVVLGEHGAIHSMAPGSILVDHTTASARLARELEAALAGKEIGFLDAPLSGGQAGAENGQLTIMVGGNEESFERARPVMDCYAKAMTLIGPAGHGQMAKMVNQICIAGVVQGLAEALSFAQHAELDVPKVIEAISKGAAQSWQMENRWETMMAGEFEFGFAVDWMRKDLAIALEEAERNGTTLDMTKLIDSYYAEVQALGGSRWDTSSLLARFNDT